MPEQLDFRILTKIASEICHFMFEDRLQMQVLDDFCLDYDTFRDCFLKKILYAKKFLALGVQILQNSPFIVHNLLDSIDPVLRRVFKLSDLITNWQKFSHRYHAVLASNNQLKLAINDIRLQFNILFHANLVLQFFENFLIKPLGQRNYSLGTDSWVDAFKVRQSFFNIDLAASKTDFVNFAVNFCVLVSWSKNKFFGLINEFFFLCWALIHQIGTFSVLLWDLVLRVWECIF